MHFYGNYERESSCKVDTSVREQQRPCPTQPEPMPAPPQHKLEFQPLEKLTRTAPNSGHNWGPPGKDPDRGEVKSNREALPPFSLSQVGSQNAACQAYICQPGTRQKANILNFGESSQGTAGPEHPQQINCQAHTHSCQTTSPVVKPPPLTLDATFLE